MYVQYIYVIIIMYSMYEFACVGFLQVLLLPQSTNIQLG